MARDVLALVIMVVLSWLQISNHLDRYSKSRLLSLAGKNAPEPGHGCELSI